MPCDICPEPLVHGVGYCPNAHAPHVILRYCAEHYDERSVLPLRCFSCGQPLWWAFGDAADRIVRPLDPRVAQAASHEAIRYKELPLVGDDALVDEDVEDDEDDELDAVGLAPSVHEFPGGDEPLVEEDDPHELEAERTEALRKIKATLANAEVTRVGSIESCDRDRPATIAVVLRSSDPSVFDVESGEIVFKVKTDTIRKRRTTQNGIKLMISDTVKVQVHGFPAGAPEFTQATLMVEFQLAPGGHRDVELVFTPRPPRRIYPRFQFFDSLDEQTRQARPFPAKYPVELVFDGASPGLAKAEVLADGTCRDLQDGKAGIRMLHRWKTVKPRFPKTDKRRYLAWTTDSAPDSPTLLIDEGTDPTEEQTLLHMLPKDPWIPATQFWTVPAEHMKDQELRKDIDISAVHSVGTANAPITYILEETHGAFINEKRIDHVVVLMLENRGFDHFMGWLYDNDNPPPNSWPAEPPENQAGLRVFEGLDGLPQEVLNNPFDYEDESGKRHHGVLAPTRGARAGNIPTTNPHEDFIHIFQDMYGMDVEFSDMALASTRDPIVKDQGRYRVPPMNGWVQNFANAIEHHRGVKTFPDSLLSEIMDMYTPEQLPVMSGLAKNFAVSDLWFCSVPSQTNTNRAYWAAGTAVGLVTNNHYDAYKSSWDPRMMAMRKIGHGSHADALPDGTRSMFDVLEQDDITWKYYWETKWPPGLVGGGQYFRTMFTQFKDAKYDDHFPKTSDFLSDARAGTLPAVTYIEPTWGGGTHWQAKARGVGNEFHPVEDTAVGEGYVKEIYDAVSQGAAWDRTLLVITFDENGGTYDHFPPWAARPSGREDGSPQFGFRFDCYGVRVPTLVISRYVKPGTVFRSPTAVPFDHTSIISTILEWQGMNPGGVGLGARVAHAPSFGGLLETDGAADGPRSRSATSLGPPVRDEDSVPLQYGDEVYLRYVGSRWPRVVRPDGAHYLGGPVWFKRYRTYYPSVTDRAGALRWKLVRGAAEGNVEAGTALQIVAASGAQAGHTLAVPEVYGADTVYLYDGSKPSAWLVWRFDDRVEGGEIHGGDEVIIYSERYLPGNVSTTVTDPFQKLTVEEQPSGWIDGNRYAKFRAGCWDIWRIERA